MYRLAALWMASRDASTLVTKNTAMTSCAHWPTNFPLRSSTSVPRSSLLRSCSLHAAAADDAPRREGVQNAPISSTEAYVARGMLRCGSCDSSPYSAADSNPMNEANANMRASPNSPDSTVDGAKTVVSDPAVPLACRTPRSRTSRIEISRSSGSIGPIRAALLVALLQTPHRFRTKRQLWAYSGFAVETHDSGEYRCVRGKLQRNRERITVRGLNDNHNKDLKNLFKSAAISASTRPGPLQDFYIALVGKGIRPTMARLTLARKIAAITLTMWKKGVSFDPKQLHRQAA